MSVAALLSELQNHGIELWADDERLRFRAPDGVMTADLRSRLSRHKPEILEALRTMGAVGHRPPCLSFAQERQWFVDRLAPGNPAYNIPLALRLRGPLDRGALAQAFGEIVRRHEALRTVCAEFEGRPAARVLPPAEIEIPLTDLACEPATRRDDEAWRHAREIAERPFDLAAGPLLRVEIFRLEAEEHLLVLVTHHLAADGWSMRLLMRDLSELYAAHVTGRPALLPKIQGRFSDHVLAKRNALSTGGFDPQLAFWRKRLEGAPPPLELPRERSAPDIGSGEAAGGFAPGGTHPIALSAELTVAVEALGRRHGATLFMTLLAAFKTLLLRTTEECDLVMATAVSERGGRDLEDVFGPLSNNLLLRTSLEGDPTFAEALGRVRETCLDAFAHQELPFEKLVETLAPDRRGRGNPLSRIFFVLQATAITSFELSGLEVTFERLYTGASKFDLSLSVEKTPQGLLGSVEYDGSAIDGASVSRLSDHFERLLEAAVESPEARLSELAILNEKERQLLIEPGPAPAYPRDATLAGLFADQAATTPKAIAVDFEDGRLTYADLDRRSDRLAVRLRELGVGPDVPVGLALEPSAMMVTAMLAIAKAGGAYLPLDPAHPTERLERVLEDAAAPVVLAVGPGVRSSGKTAATPRRHRLRLDEAASLRGTEGAPPTPGTCPDNLAYLIYTSGSTGRPKGVAVPQRAVVRLVKETDYAPLGPSDVVAQASNASFDAATFEIWGALLNGARLVGIPRAVTLSPELFAAALERHRVTALFLTTALFNQIARQAPTAFAGLTHLLFGGEAVDPNWVRRVLAGEPPERLLHVYGPTETTTFATWHQVREVTENAETVPIGKAIAASTLYVLDRRLEPVPAGVPGELYLGGDGLARGYWGRPALTAGRFVPHPFAASPGERLYRTGDRVRRRSDGAVEFLGRFDDQVKIRGFRIEPGEVEALLARHPQVAEVAVVPSEDPRGERCLTAYAVLREGSRGLSAETLRDHLSQSLPEFMVPASIRFLDRLPLNANGKVDRRALPETAPGGGAEEGEGAFAAPQTPMEELLAGIWGELLDRPRVGRGADFFRLGGHSLLTARLTSRVADRLGIEMPVMEVFERPGLAAMAEGLEAILAGGTGSAAAAIEARAPEAELPLSFAQERLWFLDRLEGPGGAVGAAYGVPAAFRLRGDLDPGILERSLGEILLRHEALRTRFATAGETPVQIIEPEAALALDRVDLSAVGEVAARAWIEEAIRRPFDLEAGPLVRAALLRLGEGDNVLLLFVHHIIADGRSLEILLGELDAIYGAFAAGSPSPLPALPIQYGDFSLWQRRHLAKERIAADIDYWRRRLEGIPALDLPTDRRRPAKPSFAGVRATRRVDRSIVEALRDLGRREGVTPFMILLAAFQVVLGRLARQSDVAVGTPVAGRGHRGVEPLVGFFVNTVVLRGSFGDGPSFRALLARTREACLEAFAHQELPYEKLVEALQPERVVGRTPLFQAMFAYQGATALPPSIGGLETEPFTFDPGVARFDLTLSAAESGDGLVTALDAAADLFTRETADRILGFLTTLLEAAVADPDLRISDLPLASPAEEREIAETWSRPDRAFGERAGEPFVHRRFEELARETPDAEALALVGTNGKGGEERWTYGDLDRRADALAEKLTAVGVGPEVVVAVHGKRSPEAVAAILAIWKAGGVYLPIDPDHPERRRRELIEDSGARVLIAGWKIHQIEEAPPNASAVPRAPAIPKAAPAESAAYLLYTSGSTGTPKGVLVSHRALAGTLAWRRAEFAPGPGDRILQNIPLSFDPSLWQIFGALTSGAAAVLVPAGRHQDPAFLADLMASERISITDFPPSLLAVLVERETFADLPDLRLIFAGGEALSPALAERFLAASRAELCNIYGPTEGAIDTTCCRCRAALEPAGETGHERVPIGRPIAGRRVHLLDEGLRPVPPAVPGELWIGGEGLARGYLGDPRKTAERFRPDPFSDRAGGRLYDSGDLARWRDGGAIEFLGRVDHQLKIRGFRVEPGEIAAVLGDHPAVAEAVVVPREEGSGAAASVALAAYWIPNPAENTGGSETDPAELRSWLAERLPAHMIPAAFVRLEALPRTPGGKLDRGRLPAPAAGDTARRAVYVAPTSKLERAISGVWCTALGVEKVGVDDNFFELGGHSLLLVRVHRELLDTLAGVGDAGGANGLSLMDLFEHPTVAALARHLVSGEGSLAEAAGSGPEGADLREARDRGRRSHTERRRRRRALQREETA